MNIQIEHTLSKQEAKSRIEKLIQYYKNKYSSDLKNLTVHWADYKAHIAFTAKGYTSSSHIEIGENIININLKIPILLQAFGQKIRSIIVNTIKQGLY